jgi:uncharacterized protein YndB with AHSA1/START domain
MTLIDTTAPSQVETISFEVDLPHSPDKVWRALTDPELMAEWLLPVTGLKLDVGAAFVLTAQPYPGWDGTVSCKLLEIEAKKKLSYTWTVPFLDTIVSFALEPSQKGTRLTIEQSGFKPDQKQESGGARYGWKMMGGKLLDLLDRLD